MVSPWKVGFLWVQRLDLEVGDRCPAHVGHAHAEHERVHEVADDDVLAVHRLVLGEPLVRVQRMVVHRDHAEQVIVVLGDRLAGPVPVDVADGEVLEVATEWPLVRRHGGEASHHRFRRGAQHPRWRAACRQCSADGRARPRHHRGRACLRSGRSHRVAPREEPTAQDRGRAPREPERAHLAATSRERPRPHADRRLRRSPRRPA